MTRMNEERLMPRFDNQMGLRFDSVAERYHETRPRYPDAIWDALVEITSTRQP